MEDERKVDRFADDIIERMGEEWPDELKFDRDGPVDAGTWWNRWDLVQASVDSRLNAIPSIAKGVEDADA